MIEELSQRELPLELRYEIDMARKHAKRYPAVSRSRIEQIRRIIAGHPRGMASQHVLHNIGKDRLDWLRKEGLL